MSEYEHETYMQALEAVLEEVPLPALFSAGDVHYHEARRREMFSANTENPNP